MIPSIFKNFRWIPDSAKFMLAGQLPKATGILQVYQLDKAELKLNFEMNTSKGLKCCTFGASNKNELACGDFDVKNILLNSHFRGN